MPDGDIALTAEELLIETAQKEGYTSVSDRGVTVVLDTALTEELVREGFVREIISKLQTMRKEAGFNVTDHIQVYCQGSEKVRQVLEENQEAILHDVAGRRLPLRYPGGLHRPAGRQRRNRHLRREARLSARQ